MTSAIASKKLKVLQDALQLALLKEKLVHSYVQLVGHTTEVPEYNFQNTQQEIEQLQDSIVSLKHKINVFNTSTQVSFDTCAGERTMFIDEALVHMSMLSKQISKLSDMAGTLPKQVVISYGEQAQERIANYHIPDAETALKQTKFELSNLQLALDTANITLDIIPE